MKKLKTFIARNRQKLIIISTILLLIIGVTNFFWVYVIRATSNDECIWVDHKEGIFFNSVKVGGVTWEAGVRNGDQLISINKERITSTTQAQLILNKVKGGNYAEYSFKKGNKLIDSKVYIKKFINISAVGVVLLGLFWLIIGFVVVMAKPNGYIQRLFYNIGACFILLATLYLLSDNTFFPKYFRLVTDLVWSAAAIYVPFLIIRFFWIFPKPFRFTQKKWVGKLLSYLPLTIYLASVIYRIAFVYYSKEQNTFYNNFVNWLNIFLLASMTVGLVSLFINYFTMKDKADKKPLVIILAAYTLGLSSIFYTIFVAPVITDTIFNSPEYYTPILLVAIIPISFGVSIFRYQLMDVSIVIKNTIIYGLATVTILVIYFFIVFITIFGIRIFINKTLFQSFWTTGEMTFSIT